jgi:outer membrane protein assembly factor BamB
MRRELLLSLLSLVLLPQVAGSQNPQSVWQLKAGAVSMSGNAPGAGLLLVASEAGLRAHDIPSGQLRWGREDLVTTPQRVVAGFEQQGLGAGGGSKPDVAELAFFVLPGDSLVAVLSDSARTRARLSMLDLATGITRWSSSTFTEGDTRGIVPVPGSALGLVAVIETRAGKKVPSVYGVNLTTGAVLWHREDLLLEAPREFRGASFNIGARGTIAGGPLPIHDADNTAVVMLADDQIVRINLVTGATVWEAALSGAKVPEVRDGAAPPWRNDADLFFPLDRRLAVLDATTGALRWRTNGNLPSRIVELEVAPEGLLVRGYPARNQDGRPIGRPFLNVVDPATGASRWMQTGGNLTPQSNLVRQDGQVYAVGEREVLKLDLVNGSAAVLPGLLLDRKNQAVRLSVTADGELLLVSAQEIARVATDGSLRFHRSVKPPGVGLFDRIALVMLFGVSGFYLNGFYVLPPTAGRAAQPEPVETIIRAAQVGEDERGGPGFLQIETATGKITGRLSYPGDPPLFFYDQQSGVLICFPGDESAAGFRF